MKDTDNTDSTDFQHRSQDDRHNEAMSIALKAAGLDVPREEEAELSFLIGAPAPDVEPQTD